LTVTDAMLDGQTPFVMVHVYTYVPYTDAVAVAAGSLVLLKVVVPGPDVCVQSPVPTVGVLPPSVVLVNDAQKFCAGPTVAVVGVAK
jgi:hypothetical protein